jgi:hypothetical protein
MMGFPLNLMTRQLCHPNAQDKVQMHQNQDIFLNLKECIVPEVVSPKTLVLPQATPVMYLGEMADAHNQEL